MATSLGAAVSAGRNSSSSSMTSVASRLSIGVGTGTGAGPTTTTAAASLRLAALLSSTTPLSQIAASGSVVAAVGQQRFYTPPSRRTWSKQHHRIRSPRPMVDRFDLSREQPQKQWWRERRIAPATYFGFPDVTKINLRGGGLYVEQMDSVTLAVLADKCLKENVDDPEIWEKFCWRAQQLSTRMHEPDLCYIFRAFSRKDWSDQHFVTTYLGRIQRRMHMMHLPDVAVVLEAFANPRFRQGEYLQKALLQLALLLQHRDDAKAAALARCCAALRLLHPLPKGLSEEVVQVLSELAEALLVRDLTEIGTSKAILVIDSFVTWGLMDTERGQEMQAPADLCWTLVRDLKGTLRAHGREKPDELATLALCLASGKLDHDEVWTELITNLEYEAHRLSGKAVAEAALGAAKAGRATGKLHEVLLRRLLEESSKLSSLDCARAVAGFCRGPAAVAEAAITKGPVSERMLELGLENFTPAELLLTIDGLARMRKGAWGGEILAGAALEALFPHLGELSLEQLAGLCRSLGSLRPSDKSILATIFDTTQAAVPKVEETPEDESELAIEHKPRITIGPSPRHLAMISQGLAGQNPQVLTDVPKRLEALLPALMNSDSDKTAAVTAATIVASLLKCPSSKLRDEVLDKYAARLEKRCHELSAHALLTSLLAMQRLNEKGWTPPTSLLEKIAMFLDMKRYDLKPGTLYKAADALKSLNCSTSLRLEPRDAAPAV